MTPTETLASPALADPGDQAELASMVRAASERRDAIYPVGGDTSLDYGLPARRPGVILSLAKLNRVIDYPARDMTITVEAGLTLGELAGALATERQWLPIDAPFPERATIGGLMATAWSGPRRYGWGTMRDYVIGASAVDGRGETFKTGGRVVKNVAGYDFCKLLTGSLGTLGVITQVTLKIKPIPESSALVACSVTDALRAESLLADLVTTRTAPASIELLRGPIWRDDPALGATANAWGQIVVGLEGAAVEVAWMTEQLQTEWRSKGIGEVVVCRDAAASALWNKLRDFPAHASPLVVQATLRPSGVCSFLELVHEIDPQASVAAHAGNGVVTVRFANFSAGDVSRVLVGRLQPAAAAQGGSLIALASEGLGELSRQATWGSVAPAAPWMARVKREFDPHDILNPGRFVYSD